MGVHSLHRVFSSGLDRNPQPAHRAGRLAVRASAACDHAVALLGSAAAPQVHALRRVQATAPHVNGYGPIDLLVLQGSTFCNIDCGYCYLPNREQTHRMSDDVLAATFKRVFESPFFSGHITLVWHAGEPLALPISFYQNAYRLMQPLVPKGARVDWSFQTNAIPLNESWVDFFQEIDAKVGVSIDGPEVLHDAFRRTRSGKGTFTSVMRGIDHLRRRKMPFSCIAVLTEPALQYPDEIYLFFRNLGCNSIGFNTDEQDGNRQTTSSYAAYSSGAYGRFMQRFWELCMRDGVPLPWVREFWRGLQSIHIGGRFGDLRMLPSQEAHPYSILTVDWEGNFSTFSPELLGAVSDTYGTWVLGNVLETSLEAAVDTEKFRRMEGEIRRGIDACRAQCDYFSFCGGGSAGNKWAEHGTADATETTFCRVNYQELTDALLSSVEDTAGRAMNASRRSPLRGGPWSGVR